MQNDKEMKHRKMMALALQFMRMVNQDSAHDVFGDIEYKEDELEIIFSAPNSASIAIEYAACICRLFNVCIMPIQKGNDIIYRLFV